VGEAGPDLVPVDHHVPSNCDFQQFAYKTVAVAKANYPETVSKLVAAWNNVGITVSA